MIQLTIELIQLEIQLIQLTIELIQLEIQLIQLEIQLTIELIQLEIQLIQLTIELIQLEIQLIQLTMAGHSADYRVDLAGHLADLARQARQRELVALIFRLSGVPEPPGQSARLDAYPHPCTPSRDQPTGSVVTQPYMAYP